MVRIWRPRYRHETVILLHGLGSFPAMMALLAWRLRFAGYRVLNPRYPSTREPLEDLVRRLGAIVDGIEGLVHFVGHSLGGIIVRAYLDQLEEPFDGRVVMLSPLTSVLSVPLWPT